MDDNEHEKTSDGNSIAKALFYYVVGPWNTLFHIAHFWVTFPSKLYENALYKKAPKRLTFQRLGEKPVTFGEAQDLIKVLHDSEVEDAAQMKSTRRPPRLYEMFEDLRDEEKDPFSKMPSVEELRLIDGAMKDDIIGRSVWALDGQRPVYVFFPSHGDVSALSKKVVIGSHRTAKHYVYAVSVTLEDKKNE